MTSTTVGLPDRYRPLERVGPEEPTATGVITSWRAKDRVLNRDVAIRVHSPGGPAAHAWIARALTAGGLATPALAMVYDASEGTADADGAGGAAYVVNEWIDGESLRERLTRGPLPDREARTILRRLAEGVAEAHRVGLAVGGLTPDNVVLRPNGLVGLRGVPASTGTVGGDISALGALLEFALTGRAGNDPAAPHRAPLPPDLAALVRRTRSTEPGQGLSSAAAMASLLTERPRAAGIPWPSEAMGSADGGRLGRHERADGAAAPAARSGAPASSRTGAHAAPPVPPAAPTGPAVPLGHPEPAFPHDGYDAADDGYDDAGPYPVGLDGEGVPGLDDEVEHEPAGLENATRRRRLVVWAVPVLALAIVIGLAVWLGTSVLSVADSVGQVKGSTPTVPNLSAGGTSGATSSASASASAARPSPGAAIPITDASVFDPFGDGEPENDNDVPKSYDGDPQTAWSTLEYRDSAAFGNLKPGVGVLYDLGSKQSLAGVTITTTLPGATVEIRTGTSADGSLDSYALARQGELTGTDQHVRFAKAVAARYVLIWITHLVPTDGNYQADLAEVSIQHAG